MDQLGYETAAFGKVAHSKSAKDYGFQTIGLQKDIPEVGEAVKNFSENRNDPRPLALFVGVSSPHVPWPSQSTVDPQTMTLPPKLLDTPQTRVQRSRYLQEVKDLDAYLGQLRSLTDKHMSRDTLFVARSGNIKPGSRTDPMV